jgi:hypothetical protein
MYIFSQDVTKRRESCTDALNPDSEVPTQDLAILERLIVFSARQTITPPTSYSDPGIVAYTISVLSWPRIFCTGLST